MGLLSVTWRQERALATDHVVGIQELLRQCAAADGVAPLGERFLLHLTSESTAAQHLVAMVGDEAVAYAQLHAHPVTSSAGLTVAPAHRGQGLGEELADRVLAAAGRTHVGVWAHGNLPAAVALAAARDFTRTRALRQMWLEVPDDLPVAGLPDGVRLRSFLPGLDDAELLEVNGAAFANLPDQGGMTAAGLAERMSAPWFDPTGFLVAVDQSDRMLGFHWTKTHQIPAPDGHRHVGEVYVVGVEPSQQGRGLGRALTLAGLHHMQRAGLHEVMLYVDETNDAALTLYADLGFDNVRTDVQYTH